MVVVAESLILLTGSFDLSLQSIYGLAPMVGAWLIVRGHGARLGLGVAGSAILVVLAIGAAVGLFNGFMIVKLRFNAFIFTLAMLILLAACSRASSAASRSTTCRAFVYLGSAYWFGFPSRPGWRCSCVARAVPALSPHRPRDLRDRRQPRGGARRRHQGRPHPHRAVLRRRRAGRGRGADDGRPDRPVVPNQGNNLIFTVFAAAVIGGIASRAAAAGCSARSPASCCSGW